MESRARPNPRVHSLLTRRWSWYRLLPVSRVLNSAVPRILLIFKDHPLLMIQASEHGHNKSYAPLHCAILNKCEFLIGWIIVQNAALCKSRKMEDAQTKLLHLKDCCHQPAFSSSLEYPQKVNDWKKSVCLSFSNMICSSQKTTTGK